LFNKLFSKETEILRVLNF